MSRILRAALSAVLIFIAQAAHSLQAVEVGNIAIPKYGQVVFGESTKYFFKLVPRDIAFSDYDLTFLKLADGKEVFTTLLTRYDVPVDKVIYSDELDLAFILKKDPNGVGYEIQSIKMIDLKKKTVTSLDEVWGGDLIEFDAKGAKLLIRRPIAGEMKIVSLPKLETTKIAYKRSNDELLAFASSELLKLKLISENPDRFDVIRMKDSKRLGTIAPEGPLLHSLNRYNLLSDRFLIIHGHQSQLIDQIFDLQSGKDLSGGLQLMPASATLFYDARELKIFRLNTAKASLDDTQTSFSMGMRLVVELFERDSKSVVYSDTSENFSIQDLGTASPVGQLNLPCGSLLKVVSRGEFVGCSDTNSAKWWKINY